MTNTPTHTHAPDRPVPTTGRECCADYEQVSGLSRRRFLAGMAAASGAAVATSMFGDAVRQAAFGASPGGNVLVVISMRGGIDGLGVVVPHADPGYYSARPDIAIPPSSLVAADEMFGLHPSMAPLEWLWKAGELAAVHAVGTSVPNRSHFLAMEEVEDADPTSSVRRGWVNRMVGLVGDGAPQDAVQLGDPIMPTALVGATPTLATRGLDDISLAGATNGFASRRRAQLSTMWSGEKGPLGVAARSALRTTKALAPVIGKTYRPSVTYPTDFPATGLSEALKDTAQLIKADLGTEVVTVDYGSWDMHANYGNQRSGEMQAMLRGFAGSVSAFLKDLGPLRSRVTVVTISEFGRRVAQNGNRGLDHGWGNMMLLMGAGVRGGYYARWPWLGAGDLEDGDLAVTTDYRDVLGEVVARRFGRTASEVFPGLVHNPLGVLR